MKGITRRMFGKTAAVSAAAALSGLSLPKMAFGQSGPEASELRYPKGFVWGCATAAYQIEGGAKDDGRGPSTWDLFSHTPGKTHEGDTGDVADDSYHLYKEDVRLLKNLGAAGYRFSMSWSRVFPTGKGEVNQKGLDYYSRVVDELLANNITPYITLFHWDTPAALQGGWQSRDTSKAFADYAAYVTKHLGDRVKHWMTTNEFVCFTDLGYKIGQFAPGMKLADGPANQVRHHGILAHGLAVQAIRANTPAGTQVGLAENANVYVPIMETKEHLEAAHRATRYGNAPFLAALMEGKYMDAYLEREGANAPKVEPGDFKAISSPLDFVGLNVYTPVFVRADDSKQGYAEIPYPTSQPHMASPWILLAPECLYWAVRNVVDLWKISGDLHYGKRLLVGRRAHAGRADRRRGPADVSAQSSDPDASRRDGGLPGKGLLPVEPAGQFRMGGRIQQAVWNPLRRLQNAEADAQAERAMVPRGDRTQRGDLKREIRREKKDLFGRWGPRHLPVIGPRILLSIRRGWTMTISS